MICYCSCPKDKQQCQQEAVDRVRSSCLATPTPPKDELIHCRVHGEGRGDGRSCRHWRLHPWSCERRQRNGACRWRLYPRSCERRQRNGACRWWWWCQDDGSLGGTPAVALHQGLRVAAQVRLQAAGLTYNLSARVGQSQELHGGVRVDDGAKLTSTIVIIGPKGGRRRDGGTR